jgi:hypothetical protein
MTPEPGSNGFHNGLGEVPVPAQRTIPFDYTFRFVLEGRLDRTHNRTIAVSIESAFTAVSIGYGVIPTVNTITFGPRPSEIPPVVDGEPGLRNLSLANVLESLKRSVEEDPGKIGATIGPKTGSALLSGFRINPQFADLALSNDGEAPLNESVFQSIFQTVAAPADRVLFLYALFDEGSGRQFQDQPLLNIAGLGSADGDRPFRPFTPPVTFAPRTNIRMEITEKSEFQGELHVSLHGYKVLGGAGTPTGRQLRRAARGRRGR